MPQVGTFIAGLSPFMIWLAPNYLGVFLFVTCLSVGEMIYSPRLTVRLQQLFALHSACRPKFISCRFLPPSRARQAAPSSLREFPKAHAQLAMQEYSMMVAPRGREGTYAALSSAPLFTAKFFVGGISGTLLQVRRLRPTAARSHAMIALGGRTLQLCAKLQAHPHSGGAVELLPRCGRNCGEPSCSRNVPLPSSHPRHLALATVRYLALLPSCPLPCLLLLISVPMLHALGTTAPRQEWQV